MYDYVSACYHDYYLSTISLKLKLKYKYKYNVYSHLTTSYPELTNTKGNDFSSKLVNQLSEESLIMQFY